MVVLIIALALVFIENPSKVGARSEGENSEYTIVVGFGPGNVQGVFSQFNDLSSSTEIIENRVVPKDSNKPVISLLPGRNLIGKVELTRSTEINMNFYNWHKLVEDGNIKDSRKNVSIEVVDSNKVIVGRWKLTNAWPSSINYDLNGELIEKVVIVYEKMERAVK